jgi:allophanate hydrolase
MNLFDLCGVAVPAGFRTDGLPFGITLVGPRGTEHALLSLAGELQPAAVKTLGALNVPVPAAVRTGVPLRPGYVAIAVCGAHMHGLPLNHQLRDRGGYLLEATRTAPCYRLVALPGGPPFRPGLVRVAASGAAAAGPGAAMQGAAIELEIWALPSEQVGGFIAGIGAPLGIGKVELESGSVVSGFICEGYALATAVDITAHGGWRGYLRASR